MASWQFGGETPPVASRRSSPVCEFHNSGYELLTTTFNIAIVQGLLALGQIEQSARLTDDAIRLVEQSGIISTCPSCCA
ncbi:hypothetical protein [Bradyrhizobium sp. 5.13L]